MIEGLIMILLGNIIGHIKLRITLSKCLVKGKITGIEVFNHKGRTYDRKKFIRCIYNERCSYDKTRIRQYFVEYKRNLKTSKTPELDLAIIEAYAKILAG